MRGKMILLVASTFAGIAFPAYAGDNLSRLFQPRWSGLYVGGYLGHHAVKTQGVYDAAELGVVPLLSRIGDRGAHGGLYAGYMLQWGIGVAGVEVDSSLGGFKGGFETVQDGSATEAGMLHYPITGELDHLTSVRARAGFSIDGPLGSGLLFYVTAGRAFTKFTMDVANGRARLGFRDNGTALGAGAELAVTQRLSLRSEILRYDFGKRLNMSDEVTSGIFDANDGNYVQLNDVHLLRVGLSYKLLP
jgi:opacity protein-like surface antigen